MALTSAIILGVIAALIIYQAQIRGLIPVISGNPIKPESIKIQTVIQEENAVTSVVENAAPSIVTITLSGGKDESSKAGTGFIVDSRGLIVTNKHTVSDPGQYVVMTKEGQKFEVKNVYKDQNLDLSLVRVDASDLKALELGDSSKLRLGQTVIAMGRSGQLGVSVGVISAFGNLIQTDALITLSNSGGPLLSSAGQVIGINLAMPGASNFGSAIPINSLKQLIDASAQSSKPFLGLTYKFISGEEASLKRTAQGASVLEISGSGPADRAGLKIGDIITKINGQTIDSENKVFDIVSRGNPGQQLDLTIWRNGQNLTMKATLETAPNNQ